MMNNYKLIIQYDGSGYAGWQMQKNSVTVQQKLVEAIEIILKEHVVLNGSGRTDTGVHALGQTANFRTASDLDLYKFKYQLNSVLPDNISVVDLQKTNEKFHSRYDAKKRSYIYLINNSKSPFLKNFSWYLSRKLDIEKLNYISAFILGKKDFSAFCRSSSETKNRICEVYSVRWRKVKGLVVFSITADRFLHGMVRTIIGTLLNAVEMEDPQSYLNTIILAKDRISAGESVPAHGLFLYKVKYED